MLATLYTEVPASFQAMRKGLHTDSPQATLARNLKAAFQARDLSGRRAADLIRQGQGLKISNKTVSNMLNGDGNPQLDGLTAVAKHLRIPLWQLLCPGMEISQFNDAAVHELLNAFAGLSELGRKGALKHIKGQLLLEQAERPSPTDSSHSETAT